MRRILLLTALCLILITSFPVNGQIRVALSKSFPTYEAWLRKADPSVVIVNMYGLRPADALKMLGSCSGLLLTGGEDVDPASYGKLNELQKCEEIDKYRDTLEFSLISRAKDLGMPVFGICRGEQILNVAMGGTLITDIPSFIGTDVLHRSSDDPKGCLHIVNIDKKSLLYSILGIANDTVNSYHHQAIDRVAPGFKVSARSSNGVAESLERISPEGQPFMMAVQWHPEKSTQKSELSAPLAQYFMSHIKEFYMAHNK